MHIESKWILASISLVFAGCSSPKTALDTKSTLKLEKVEQLRINTSNQQETLGIFGEPDRRISLQKGEAWLYFGGESQLGPRLTLVFEPQEKVLQEASWQIRATDPEADLSVAKARFKNANFTVRKQEWVNPHAAPDEEFVEDKALGIGFVYRETIAKVETIFWASPHDLDTDRNNASQSRSIKWQP